MIKSNLPLAALVCAAALLLFTTPGQAQPSLQAVHNHVRPAVASGQAAPVGPNRKGFSFVNDGLPPYTENRTFYSPDREPSFDLNVPVKPIAGLNNFSIPRPMLKKRAAASAIHSNA